MTVCGTSAPSDTMDAGLETVHTDDRILVERLRSGDPGAIDEIVERYKRPVYAFIIRMIGNRDTADDLFQETWLRVVRSAGSFRGDAKISTWLFQIALNQCRDHIRKTGKVQLTSLEDAEQLTFDPGIDPLKMLEADRVRAMIRELPQKMREVIVLRMYHDLDDREIAAAIGCPVGTVKTRYHRALKLLEKKWDLRSRR